MNAQRILSSGSLLAKDFLDTFVRYVELGFLEDGRVKKDDRFLNSNLSLRLGFQEIDSIHSYNGLNCSFVFSNFVEGREQRHILGLDFICPTLNTPCI